MQRDVPGLAVQVIQHCLVPSEIADGFKPLHQAAASVPEGAPVTAGVVEDMNP